MIAPRAQSRKSLTKNMGKTKVMRQPDYYWWTHSIHLYRKYIIPWLPEISLWSRPALPSDGFGENLGQTWHHKENKSSSLQGCCPPSYMVYKAVVITSVLYACEAWTTCCRHIRKLNHFHLKLMDIKGKDKISDTEVQKREDMSWIEAMIIRAQP